MSRILSGAIFCSLVAAGLTRTSLAAPTDNGWDTDHIYVIRAGQNADGEIRRLNENTNADAGRLGGDLTGDTKPKSLCFSNSPAAGANSPKGARMWGLINWPEDPGEPNTRSFRVYEFSSAGGAILRHFYAGLAGGGTGRGELNGPDGRVNVGTIRYNPAKNTIAVAANIAKDIDSGAGHPIVQGTQKAMVYEFALPDWPTPQAGLPEPTLVQRYELPGKAINDTGTRIDFPPVIDFDNVGNMYVFGRYYDANTDGFRDIIRFSTLGKNAGLNTYKPTLGTDAELLINGITECNQNPNDCTVCNNNPDWRCGGGGWAISFRPGAGTNHNDQLVVGPLSICDPFQTLIYDLVGPRQGNGNLSLALRLPGPCDIPRDGRYAQRDVDSHKIYFGHNQGNCCDPGGNFMYLNNNWNPVGPTNTMTKDVAYCLTLPGSSCPAGACNTSGYCTLNKLWDAASPPSTPGPAPTGACCQAGHACSSLTQSACSAAGGLWQGANTTCGQFPCEGACCNGPCNACQQSRPNDCAGAGKTWAGYGTLCGQVACPLQCATPSADGDCDGDVDMNDFALFQRCYNPGGPIPSTPFNCACFDRATPAGQIDHFDFDAIFNPGCAKGSGVPPGSCP